MELRIRDSEGFVDKGFGWWLVFRIKVKLISNIKNYKLDNWDKYLNEATELNRLFNRKYKTADVITFAAKNIICEGSAGEITLRFDDTKFVPGFDRLKLTTLLKTINFGTLSIKGCPIFSDTFNYFSEDIDTYVRLYYRL